MPHVPVGAAVLEPACMNAWRDFNDAAALPEDGGTEIPTAGKIAIDGIPTGGQSIHINAGTVAVDPAVTPLGSVGWLAIRLPDGREFSQFVLAMDTGAAIRGPGRIDLFLGPGDEAERVAGELRVRGEVTWFVPPRS